MDIYDGDKLTTVHYKKEIHDKIQRRLQLLQSLRDRKIISTRSYKKARRRTRRRWVYLRDDMHYKCADYLVSNYKVIGLPPFETSKMVSNTGYLKKKTKIEMLNWGHYKFKQKLLSKARNQSYVLNTDESYTTQGCTSCGTLKHMSGWEKIYGCPKCDNVIGRNDGSARSIFMCTMHKRFV
jgi:putative transposase